MALIKKHACLGALNLQIKVTHHKILQVFVGTGVLDSTFSLATVRKPPTGLPWMRLECGLEVCVTFPPGSESSESLDAPCVFCVSSRKSFLQEREPHSMSGTQGYSDASTAFQRYDGFIQQDEPLM